MKILEIIDTAELSDEKWVYVEMRLDNECVNLMLKKQKNTKIFFLKRLHSLSIRDEYPIRAK